MHKSRLFDGVFIAKDDTDFINCVDSAIAISKDENIKIKLLEYAKQNTWAQRAIDIANFFGVNNV